LLSWRSRLAWVHEKTDAPAATASFQTLPGSSFTVIGAQPSPDRLLISTGAEMRFLNGFAVAAKLDGEFAEKSQTYVGTATIRYQW
jgi:uncharacterized protein with beta-barrel porin domain